MSNLTMKNLRIAKGKTQKQIATDLGITPEYYGKIETCKQNPGFKLAKRMADYFNVTFDELFFSEKL